MKVRGRRGRMPVTLSLVLAGFGLGALVAPAAFAAPAEQFVITLVDEPADLEFDDPCTGEAVHGVGFESGVVRFTDLGDQGHHQRDTVRGVADLYDSEDNFVGTWTYRLQFRDQFPPDGQGAVLLIAVGPLEYADGHTAIVRVLFEHTVSARETSSSASSQRQAAADNGVAAKQASGLVAGLGPGFTRNRPASDTR